MKLDFGDVRTRDDFSVLDVLIPNLFETLKNETSAFLINYLNIHLQRKVEKSK